MSHGEATVQICTLLTGAALAAPKLGTSFGPEPWVALGVAWGEVVACADGVVWTWPTTAGLPRFESTTTPTIPSRTMMITATAAGMSHGGGPAGVAPPAGRPRMGGLRGGGEGGGPARRGAGGKGGAGARRGRPAT